ncbi:MAG: hypothetical protein QMC77_01920 [Methanocellales archaeon]|nr:hypothetical protein [Methanocellales archaeon]
MIILDVNTTEEPDYDLIEKKLITIGTKTDGNIKIWHIKDYDCERGMLKDFLEWFISNGDEKIVGFNILKFDIPLLLLKSQSVDKTKELYQRFFKSDVIDLFGILTYLYNKMKSLEEWCKYFDIDYKGKLKHPCITSEKLVFGTKNLIDHQDEIEYQKRELIAIDKLYRKVIN